jgi:hypothetical protein
MTGRRALRAVYWPLVVLTAATTSIAAAVPFSGGTASAVGVIAAAFVLLAGLALEPRGKARR